MMKFTSQQRTLFFIAVFALAAIILHMRRIDSAQETNLQEIATQDDHYELIVSAYHQSIQDINHFGDLSSAHAEAELDQQMVRELIANFEQSALAVLQHGQGIPAKHFCEGVPEPCDYTGRLSVLRQLVVHTVSAYEEDDRNKPISRTQALMLQQRFMRELHVEWMAEQKPAERSRRADAMCVVVKDFPESHGLKDAQVRQLGCEHAYTNTYLPVRYSRSSY